MRAADARTTGRAKSETFSHPFLRPQDLAYRATPITTDTILTRSITDSAASIDLEAYNVDKHAKNTTDASTAVEASALYALARDACMAAARLAHSTCTLYVEAAAHAATAHLSAWYS